MSELIALQQWEFDEASETLYLVGLVDDSVQVYPGSPDRLEPPQFAAGICEAACFYPLDQDENPPSEKDVYDYISNRSIDWKLIPFES